MNSRLTGDLLYASDVESPQLTFADHLEELRRRLGICLAWVIVATGAGFWLAERLIGWLKRPAGDLLPRLAFFGPTDALVAYVKVALTFGVVVTLPVVLAQVWAFVRAGLTTRERRYGVAFVWGGSACFALGVAFAYWLCLPVFLHVLLGIGRSTLEPVISINRYLGFVLGVMLSCGLVFELPLAVVLLARMGLVTVAMLRAQRRWAFLVMLVAAAVVTPTTDAVSLVLFTVPLVLLYELSILLVRWGTPASGASTRR